MAEILLAGMLASKQTKKIPKEQSDQFSFCLSTSGSEDILFFLCFHLYVCLKIVLLNLLNSSWKKDKMLGKPHILSLFLNFFNKFNKAQALMLDPIFSQ